MSIYDVTHPRCHWCGNTDPELIGRHVETISKMRPFDGRVVSVNIDRGLKCKACGEAESPPTGQRPESAGALVILESPYGSPYAGVRALNIDYARRAVRDSLVRGEYPIASHLLYTQPGILRDDVPDEREWGIRAGLAWRAAAQKAVFYVDRGWSPGMLAAREIYEREGKPFEMRSLPVVQKGAP